MKRMIFPEGFTTSSPIPRNLQLRMTSDLRAKYARIKLAMLRVGYTFPDGTPFNGSIAHMVKLLLDSYIEDSTEIDSSYDPVQAAMSAATTKKPVLNKKK